MAIFGFVPTKGKEKQTASTATDTAATASSSKSDVIKSEFSTSEKNMSFYIHVYVIFLEVQKYVAISIS